MQSDVWAVCLRMNFVFISHLFFLNFHIKTALEHLLEGVVSKILLFVTNVIVANSRITYLCRCKINFGMGLLFNHESGLVLNFHCGSHY